MRYLFFIVFFILEIVSYSQEVKIIDTDTGKPVSNVIIYNISKTTTTTSNSKGISTISDFKEKETIIFSHVSYSLVKSNKKKLRQENFTLYLKKQSEELDEIVLSLLTTLFEGNNIMSFTQ